MRNVYHDELVGLVDTLVEMTQLAESAMTRATTAPLDADRELAETVISADRRIDELQRDLDSWLAEYNEVRPHQGRWCYGKTPMQTFLASLPLAREKMLRAP